MSGALGARLPLGFQIDARVSGCKGDGVTDDRATIMAMVATAKERGLPIRFGPGRYLVSKYVPIADAVNLHIYGENATIVFPSNDVTLVADGTAPTDPAARSAFLFLHCNGIRLEDMGFEGSTSRLVDAENFGAAAFCQHVQRFKHIRTRLLYGGSMHQQDQAADTTGTGDSITVSSGVATLVDSAGLFSPAMVGLTIPISNCTNPNNNGVFVVASYVSATTITYKNAAAVNETSSFTWLVEDRDDRTLLLDCDQDKTRFINTLPGHSKVRGGHYRWPTETQDTCGLGTSLVFSSGTTVTLTNPAAKFTRYHNGKYIKIAAADTSANNGTFGPCTYISPTQIAFPNAAGVTELYTGNWWLINGTKIGLGNGVGALTKVGSVMTLTASAPVFTAADVGMAVRLATPINSINSDSNTSVSAVLSSTQITFTDSSGVAEDFAGVWTLDDFDASGGTGALVGSTHGFYVFAGNAGIDGRPSLLFEGVTFDGNKTCCIKASGSATPINGLMIRNCFARNCNAFCVIGADDAQEHNNISVLGNVLVDCGPVHRRGQVGNPAMLILGAKNVKIEDNQFHYTRESIFHQYTSTGGLYGIFAERYVQDSSQPLENISIRRNQFTSDPAAVSVGAFVLENAIRVQRAGQKAKTNTGGTLARTSFTCTANAGTDLVTKASHGFETGHGPFRFTFTGTTPTPLAAGTDYYAIVASSSTFKVATSFANAMAGTFLDITVSSTATMTCITNEMTLTDATANFQETDDVGKSITFVFAPDAANNGTFPVRTVPGSGTKVTFLNSAGVGGGVSAGTWRLPPRDGQGDSSVAIEDNEILNVANAGIYVTNCTSPQILRNKFLNCSFDVYLDANRSPLVTGNVTLGASKNTASGGGIKPRLQLTSTNMWPIVYDNYSAALDSLGASARGWGISIDTSGTYEDHPLLGKTVRARPTDSREEVVVAYGKPVDGDGINVNGTTFLFKTAITDAVTQFNSFATLVALINLIGGAGTTYEATDYGTGFATGDVITQHLRIRKVAQTTSDGTFYVTTSPLKPNALIVLPNDSVSPNIKCFSRGSGSAGPISNKTVIWSPLASRSAGAEIWADNSAARTLLASGCGATGSITCTAKANYIDGETTTVPDGINPAKVYEYRAAGGPTGTNIKIDISGATTATDVATLQAAAIAANQPAIGIVQASGVLALTHIWPGTGGNATITKTVAHAGHVVAGMSGGDRGGWHPVKNAFDSGSCEVMRHAKIAGGEEIRGRL